ncbi:MAG: SET domain-containing protein-lysine N-methyltransferase [Candidatus Aenigmatarchaeota archaeon]
MLRNVIVKNAGKKGKGVFAARDFRKGDLIMPIKGRLIKEKTEHSIQVSPVSHIDPEPPARFANHSCDPNSGICMKKGRPWLCAMKRIENGEEITWDYAMSEYDFNCFMSCRCGSKTCRKLICPYLFLDKKMIRHYKNFVMPYLKKMPMKNAAVMMAGRKGLGVFACRDFSKGDVVLCYKRSRIFKGSEVPKVWRGKFRYLDRVGKDKYMIMQPPERYINHSCDPNVFIKNRKIVAMKPIKRCDEVVFDYSINSDFPVAFKCRCGAGNCRGVYSVSFFKLDRKLQKKYLPFLDTWFKKLYRKKLEKLARGK